MRKFSKSKLLALRQCPKKLWLEIHRPDLNVPSSAAMVRFKEGYRVGDIAQKLYDPENKATIINAQSDGYSYAFKKTEELLQTAQPIFEAGFSAEGALAFADVMLPEVQNGVLSWHMIEIKSSTSVKDNYLDDVAIQAFVAQSTGVPLKSVILAHIDSSWVYPGNDDYRGLLKEVDLTAVAFARTEEVKSWVTQAHNVASETVEPDIMTGKHCNEPYECGFYAYCSRDEHKPEYPVQWLPKIQTKALKTMIAENPSADLNTIPDTLLNETQLRVKTHTLSNTVYFDAESAAAELSQYPLPAYFLDFETINLAVPIWKGIRPYQQVNFQFSLHAITNKGVLEHSEFIDLSGNNPSESFARELVASCGEEGPVYVYNETFEKTRIRELAEQYPELSTKLLKIRERIVDLMPITRKYYYHPSQQGSWSIKEVLPAVVPELSYKNLEGVQNGGMAMDVFTECINTNTSYARKVEIEQQLLAYCKLDTYAMVRLWQVFAGQHSLKL